MMMFNNNDFIVLSAIFQVLSPSAFLQHALQEYVFKWIMQVLDS